MSQAFPVHGILLVVCVLLVFYGLLRHTQSVLSADPAVDAFPSFPPHSFEELRHGAQSIRMAVSKHPVLITALLSSAFLLKQAFSVPGSGLLNLCSGIAYGYFGIVFASALTGLGCVLAFLLSRYYGGYIIERFSLQERLLPLRIRVDVARSRGSLFWYLLSLRVVPAFPQWLLNLASPHLAIPIPLFWATATLGLTPYNALVVSAGAQIAELRSFGDVLSVRTLLGLAGLAALALIPAILMKRYEERIDTAMVTTEIAQAEIEHEQEIRMEKKQ